MTRIAKAKLPSSYVDTRLQRVMDWEYERKAKWKMQKVEPKFKRKNTVARAKPIALDETYKELEEKGEERKALRIAKAQDKATKDYTQIRQIKDGEGMVLNEEEKIRDRWKSYFKSLLNEENPRAGFEDGALNLGVTCAMVRQEVREALRKIENGKATGPDDIPAEVWKCLGDERIHMLINESRIRKETVIGDEQFGFIPGKGTMDAVLALRQLMERHREIRQGLHMVFIDIEKAYDRVPSPYLFDLIMDVLAEGVLEQAPWCITFADDIFIATTRVDRA
nr:uncharacterized protein LOC113805759 [Penaeus vannamei]